MRIGALCFLGGVFAFQHCPDLPAPWYAALLPAAGIAWMRGGRASSIAACAAGFLYALLRAHVLAPDALPSEWESRDLEVKGRVVGLPERNADRTRFEFDVHRIEQFSKDGALIDLPWRVRLNWYRDAPPLRAGERWRLHVRLKRPRGFANPGGFDYEGWLFRRGITATGYVRSGDNALTSSATWNLARFRQSLSERIDAALGTAPLRPLVKALALGMRGEMSIAQWDVLRRTGTAHLMAISGLHVGLVSGLAFGIFSFAWRLPGTSVLLVDARRMGAVAAMAAALAYAALAGFSVPTQRAAVMVVCLMLAMLSRRAVAPSTLLGRALIAVLLLDPFAVNETSFWLSFSAVALILYGVSGRLALRRSTGRALWWRFGRIQCLLGLALLPLGFWFFGEFPVAAPLENAFAVPWVSTLVVPPVLAGTVVSAVLPAVGAPALEVGHLALSWLWTALEWLAQSIPVLPAGPAGPRWQMLAALVGAILLFAPGGVAGTLARGAVDGATALRATVSGAGRRPSGHRAGRRTGLVGSVAHPRSHARLRYRAALQRPFRHRGGGGGAFSAAHGRTRSRYAGAQSPSPGPRGGRRERRAERESRAHPDERVLVGGPGGALSDRPGMALERRSVHGVASAAGRARYRQRGLLRDSGDDWQVLGASHRRHRGEE